ncbi:hypothetical protein GTV32_17530 [Gordonia sp. SID5947]|uniref:hypothetical protein n=1 Tax=Gordonia sp. SID5947 TaxID=2690315 RepID=UPI00136B1BA5|nr:hypothetical protein [Gordonia sp. SID5947]MYR07988.1 hypothetical protein [Gordonia sp. SID5947]
MSTGELSIGLRARARAQLEPLSADGAIVPVLAGLVGRIPLGTAGLVVVLFLRASGFGYLEIGSIVAISTTCAALMGPVLARIIDRFGQTPVLLPLAIASPVASLLIIPFADRHMFVMTAVVAALGAPSSLLFRRVCGPRGRPCWVRSRCANVR